MTNLKIIIVTIVAATLPFLATSFNPSIPSFRTSSSTKVNMSSSTALKSKPFVICVEAVIEPDRIDEFLVVIQEDKAGSMEEEGCIRFGEC